MGIQCCQPHWGALREKLDARGLTPLIPRDGKEALDRMVEEIQSPAASNPVETFDPLMGCWSRLMDAYLRDVGLGPMMAAEMICPLCEVERSRAGLAENWLEGVSTEALNAARDLGLVPAQQ